MIRRWVVFWDRREAPTSLSLVRVFVALVILGDLLIAWQLQLVPDVWAPPPFGLGHGGLDASAPWSVRWFGASPETAEGVWAFTVLAAFMLLTGTLTPIAGIATALGSSQLAALSPSGDRGIDDLLRIVSVLLAFSGAGARWSVDAAMRRALKRPVCDRVPAWPRYLLLLQLLWVYFSAAQHRGHAAWWPHGGLTALGTILSDPHYASLEPGWAATVYPLLQAGTVMTMAFELSAPLLLLWTYYERTPRWPGMLRRIANVLKFRWVWIGTGVVFHFGIAATMRLGIFPFGMLALYPALFHPDELSRAARRWSGIWRSAFPKSEGASHATPQ